MTTKPKTRKAPAAKASADSDPIFALIDEHKALDKECWERVYYKLDEAESQAEKAHGDERPFMWRGSGPVHPGNSIDVYRDALLRLHGADREQIEKEYKDAKARFAAWDRRVGIAPLREQYERTERACTKRKPTTLAGIAALVNYIRRDLVVSKGSAIPALKTAAAALTRMDAATGPLTWGARPDQGPSS